MTNIRQAVSELRGVEEVGLANRNRFQFISLSFKFQDEQMSNAYFWKGQVKGYLYGWFKSSKDLVILKREDLHVIFSQESGIVLFPLG